jgi:hypothetical protein
LSEITQADERRRSTRRRAEGTGEVRFGAEAFACRILDVSDTGAQIRIDGRRGSRSLVGKRASLAIEGAGSGDATAREGRVVWARPAVAGVYVGLAFA